MNERVSIRLLPTGVAGLDAILRGGLPEFSFNLIAGPPGAGKTTLAHQIMFSQAGAERRALYFTALGEPAVKLLRYQQQFAFFDIGKVNTAIRFVNLADDFAAGNYARVVDRMQAEVAAFSPSLVFVDSFRSLFQEAQQPTSRADTLQQFIQQLAVQLASWQATTFLISEFAGEREPVSSILTVADGVIFLSQSIHRNSMVRKLQVVKMRGQATSPGLHTFRIGGAGLDVFPAALIGDDAGPTPAYQVERQPGARLPIGVPRLDKMLGGGLPAGYSLLIAGPSGSGKTVLARAFLEEGVRRGEPGILVAFEQTPSLTRDRSIHELVQAGQIGLINLRTLDLSIDEIVQVLTQMIARRQAQRVVIDSLSGFELSVAPDFRADFRESLFRMVTVLATVGVTVVLTSELEDRYIDLRFSPYGSAFLTDAIIVQRYIEVESELKRVIAVVKVRGSDHSKELREFSITDAGIVIGEPLPMFAGLLGGRPSRAGVATALSERSPE